MILSKLWSLTADSMVLSVYFQLIVKDGNRRLMQQIGEHFKSVESCNSMYLLFILKSWFCWVSLFVGVDCERVYVYRLWRTVQGEMQSSLKAEPVPQGMWDLLCQMQVRSTWDCRQQGAVRGLLYWHDHPWQQDQVPMSPFIPLKQGQWMGSLSHVYLPPCCKVE